jgi:hypothetical protein
LDRAHDLAGVPRGKRLERLADECRRRARAYRDAERRRAEGNRHAKLPSLPPELAFARSVDISRLRPWEYWAADSAELYEIAKLQAAWHEGLEESSATEKRSTTKAWEPEG